jgi:hypothetical protein
MNIVPNSNKFSINNNSHIHLLNYYLYKQKHLKYDVFIPRPISDLSNKLVMQTKLDTMIEQQDEFQKKILKYKKQIQDHKQETVCTIELETKQKTVLDLYIMKETYEEHIFHLTTAISKHKEQVTTFFEDELCIIEKKPIEKISEKIIGKNPIGKKIIIRENLEKCIEDDFDFHFIISEDMQ